MPDIYRINYNGVEPRPIYEDLFNFEDYPVKRPDRSATFYKRISVVDSVSGYRYDGITGTRAKIKLLTGKRKR